MTTSRAEAFAAPLIISGLGGSGTRVVAEMCMHLGFHLGDDLNEAKDNLLFTLLAKRPTWLARAGLDAPAAEVAEMLAIFAALSTSRSSVRAPLALRQLSAASIDQVSRGTEGSSVPRRAVWTAQRWRKLVRASARPRAAWGWKEPTAHVYLPHLIRHFPKMRYVHVVRDPADYAVVPHNQSIVWGPLLGVEPARSWDELVARQLSYWAAANRRAVALVRDASVPHLVVRLEDLVEEPMKTVAALATFTGVSAERITADELDTMVSKPRSMGRGALTDVAALLSPGDRASVSQFGYGL